MSSVLPSFRLFAVWFVAISALMAVQSTFGNNYQNLDPAVQALVKQLEDKFRAGERYLPGYDLRRTRPSGPPRIYTPSRPLETYTKFPWKEDIVTTIFWCGELPTQNNPTPNTASSWDTKWQETFGGYDDPNPANRAPGEFRPKSFIPGQNPFYIALPYNDVEGWKKPRKTQKLIPWYKDRYNNDGHTILKGQWIAIRYAGRTCYAQWEDVGPFLVDDFNYVFGDARPATTGNKGAGLDISPAVRDYLQMRSGAKTDWRFVELDEIPPGPWRTYGTNNPFVIFRQKQVEKRRLAEEAKKKELQAYMVKLREARDAQFLETPLPR